MRLGFTRREWLLIAISVLLFCAWWADRYFLLEKLHTATAAVKSTNELLEAANRTLRQANQGAQPVEDGLRPLSRTRRPN